MKKRREEKIFRFKQLRWPSGKSVCPWSGAVDSALIPSLVTPMTLKLVFTASLLDALH